MGFILPHKNTKKSRSTLFKQILDLVPKHIFYDAVHRFDLDKGCSTYMAYDHVCTHDFRTAKGGIKIQTITICCQ